MCGAKYNAHTEPLLKGCNILKFEDIFKLSCLKLYHKYINRMLPSFFNNIFTMNTDIHLFETRNRDNPHYFPYNREGASKRNRHSMPNLINLLCADVRLKINSLNLKQFMSFYKSVTIASYDASCTIPGCYVCGNNWGICDYWLLVCIMRTHHAGYVHVGACTCACACMCMYSGCTCACNACPINRICITTYTHYMFVFLIFRIMMYS